MRNVEHGVVSEQRDDPQQRIELDGARSTHGTGSRVVNIIKE